MRIGLTGIFVDDQDRAERFYRGMEADGSWSLDSRRSGFEKMDSGLNGWAIDFATFGLLYAHGAAWRGHQLVPAYRHWPQVLSDLARRLDGSPSARGS